jgi:hypothetical protein
MITMRDSEFALSWWTVVETHPRHLLGGGATATWINAEQTTRLLSQQLKLKSADGAEIVDCINPRCLTVFAGHRYGVVRHHGRIVARINYTMGKYWICLRNEFPLHMVLWMSLLAAYYLRWPDLAWPLAMMAVLLWLLSWAVTLLFFDIWNHTRLSRRCRLKHFLETVIRE